MENVLRLLIAEASVNDAEMLISVLRNAGTAVRATHAEDEEDVQQALDEKPFDLFLCSTVLEPLPLAAAAQLIQQSGKDIPIIAIGETDTPERRRETMHHGAADMVSKSDLDHLQLVIAREVANLNDRRRLRRLESALREAEKRCNALLDSSRDAIAYVHEGMHIYANPAYLEKFGFENFEEIEGTPVLDMVSSDSQSAFRDLLRAYDRGDHSNDEIEVNMQILGSSVPVQLTLAPASIEGESCTQILIRDRSSDEELQAQLDTLAKQDLLTGLYNRSHFMERLEDALSASGDTHASQRALIYIKLDNLDSIRQSLGIAATDLIIGDAAGLVRGETSEEEVAARFADDAFAILCRGKNIHETISLSEAIRQSLEEHVAEAGDKTITTSCSIGIAMIGDRIGTAGEAISAAHQACDLARSEGGNRVHLFSSSPGGDEGENPEEDWATRLEDALANDLLILMYQPIVSLSGDGQERYEVRLRMHGENGLVAPNVFMPHADRLQLMPTVDRWVVRQVLAIAAARAKDGHNTQFFLKLSGATVADEGFLKFITSELQSVSDTIAPSQLVLEVNEPIAVTQLNQTKTLFRGVKEAGCGFCLDHFGSGLNPFQLVKHVPADFLKLDRTLVENLPESQENAESIHQITENAHAMQKKVIAGHIEEASHLASLWQSKTDFAQGSFLQEPQRDMAYDFSGLVL